MSDTDVEGTPDEAEVRDEDVTAPDGEVEARDDDLAFLPTGGHHEADWKRSMVIVLPLVLGLLVVAAIGAKMLVAEVPDPAADPAEAYAVPADSLCWDGSDKPADGCPVPSGRTGLRWVFPSFRPNDLGCRNVLPDYPRSTRPQMYECLVTVDGEPVAITYNQLTQATRGRMSYEALYGVPPEDVEDDGGRRLLWTEGDDVGADGDYDLAVMYPALPFSVEISSGSAEARDAALASVVLFRASDDVMDHP